MSTNPWDNFEFKLPNETLRAMESLRESLLKQARSPFAPSTQNLITGRMADKFMQAAKPAMPDVNELMRKAMGVDRLASSAQLALQGMVGGEMSPGMKLALNPVPQDYLNTLEAFKRLSGLTSTLSAKTAVWGADNPVTIAKFAENDPQVRALVEEVKEDPELGERLLTTVRLFASSKSSQVLIVVVACVLSLATTKPEDAEEFILTLSSTLFSIYVANVMAWQQSTRNNLLYGADSTHDEGED